MKRAVATAVIKKRKSKSPKKEYPGNLSRNMGIGFNEWHAYQTVGATRNVLSKSAGAQRGGRRRNIASSALKIDPPKVEGALTRSTDRMSKLLT